MEQILTFAREASPLAVIAMLVGALVWLTYKAYIDKGNTRLLKDGVQAAHQVRDIQEEKYNDHEARFNKIDNRLEIIANNHLHDLPAMMQSISRIEGKIDNMGEKLESHGNRLTRLETKIEK